MYEYILALLPCLQHLNLNYIYILPPVVQSYTDVWFVRMHLESDSESIRACLSVYLFVWMHAIPKRT